MIKSLKDECAYNIYHGMRSLKFPIDMQNVCRRKLRMIDNAHQLNDLKIPPGNRLEALKGKLKDYYSIRINDQWRLIFKWLQGDAYELEIVDYH